MDNKVLLGLAAIGAIIWLASRKSEAAPVVKVAPGQMGNQPCSEANRTPWLNNPNKEAFLKYARAHTTSEPGAPIDLSEMCQMWSDYIKQ